MGEHAFIVVDQDAAIEEAPRLARAVTQLLQDLEVIKPELEGVTHHNHEHRGYRPGERALEMFDVVPPTRFTPEWSEVVVVAQRKLVHAGDSGYPTVHCPDCGVKIPDGAWCEAAREWTVEQRAATITCPECYCDRRLQDYKFSPQWAFGCLRIEFWEWPMPSRALIKAIQETLNHAVVIVDYYD